MRQSWPIVLALLASSAAPALAEKIPADFRSAFEGRVHKGGFGVVVERGVPTTSIYGVKGDETSAYYSVDVKGGAWQKSEGWLDLNQVAADALGQGEVMEVVDVTFKDNRIDLRMVSVEAHKVSRGSGFAATTRREPVSTNFKFFFPFPIRGAADLGPALEYVERFLRLFPSEDSARAFSARLLSGGPASARAGSASHPPAARPAAAASAPTTRKEIKAGMGMLEVIEVLGKPQKEVSFESKTRWTYPDLTVTFVNGKVTKVDF